MSHPIFPSEILENTVEVYHTQIKTSGKIIYLLLVSMVLMVLAALPLVKVNITTQSRGVLRSPYENTTIQSAVYGEVRSYGMYENKTVKQGDTLLILNTEQLDEQIALNLQKIREDSDFMADLGYLCTSQYARIKSPEYMSALHQYLAKIYQMQVSVSYLKKLEATDLQIYRKNAISKFDYLASKNNYDKAAEELAATKKEYIANWQADITTLQQSILELQSSIKQIDKEKIQYVITAPISGTLTQVAGFRKGNFIAPSQTLAYISTDDSLLAECYVSPSDIGYIKQNQKVNFQFDAFNYNDWGMLQGHVSQILNDVVTVNNETKFRVRCKLDGRTLHLKNGYTGTVEKGMTFTARFYITRRSLWNLLFDKLDNWLNTKIVKEDGES